jgi:hypothetical protein
MPFDRSRRHRAWAVLLLLAVTAGLVLLPVSADAGTAPPPPPLVPRGASEKATGPPLIWMGDPDTIAVAGTDDYVTYGTWDPGDNLCNQSNFVFVPYVRSTTINITGLCRTGDAMPSGPGPWANPSSPVWAPSVVRWNGQYLMYYSAQKPSGQVCIGRATSPSANGPFTGQTEVACPGLGRWAIDPDPIVDGGQLYLAYRDDAITSGNETGLSIVRMNADGSGNFATRQTLLLSTDVGWDLAAATNTYVIENPSLFRSSNGRVYLFFSGNDWDSAQYAIGMADCGTKVIDDNPTRCTVLGSYNQPYFGWSGRVGNSPQYTLPVDGKGPGGMSVFQRHGGGFAVTWAYRYLPGRRLVLNGLLSQPSTGYFEVN